MLSKVVGSPKRFCCSEFVSFSSGNFNPYIFGTADRTGFGDSEFDLGEGKFSKEHRGQSFSQGLDELEPAFGDERDRFFGDPFVIDSILNPVFLGSTPDIGREFEINPDLLPDLSLPIKNPDEALDFQLLNKDFISHGGSV